MGVTQRKALPELANITTTHPLSANGAANVAEARHAVERILSGKDGRALCIVGPCSAWPSEAVLSYAERLAALAQSVEEHVFIVMRVYTQKPRTTKGWAGVIVQPDPFAAPDVAKGAMYARDMMLRVIECGLPVADELLFTHKAAWLGDLLSWAAIGARSAEDQEHRVFASGLDMPVGLKNPTSGDIGIAVNSVVSAQSSHTYFAAGEQVATNGNPYAHTVLRGGSNGPNHDARTVEAAAQRMANAGVQNPAILIDASHDNTRHDGSKDYSRQHVVVEELLHDRKAGKPGTELVKGLLVESYIEGGAQKLDVCTADTVDRSGLSITDPCLSWDETERLVHALVEGW